MGPCSTSERGSFTFQCKSGLSPNRKSNFRSQSPDLDYVNMVKSKTFTE